jgi:predicted amino acid dehydrogenase
MSSGWASLPVQLALSAFPMLPGLNVSRGLSIPVILGNSCRVVLAVEASLAAARHTGLDPAQAITNDVGAYGPTGCACAWLLAQSILYLALVGRHMGRLQEIRRVI